MPARSEPVTLFLWVRVAAGENWGNEPSNGSVKFRVYVDNVLR